MAGNRLHNVLNYLVKESGRWISAQVLADHAGVSTRQIRKYISTINDRCDAFTLIASGPGGYCLNPELYFSYREIVDAQKHNTPATRHLYILQKLIVSKDGGYDVFDLADELFVSVATIEQSLKTVREKLAGYGLVLRREKDNIYLDGDENKKRALIREIISPDGYNEFALQDEVQLLTFHYHYSDFRKNIKRILTDEHGIFVNDYALNNIAMHLIVMIDRIHNGYSLNESENVSSLEDSLHHRAAAALAVHIHSVYGVTVNRTELSGLALILSNNSTTLDYNAINAQNIGKYIDEKYIQIANKVIRKIEENYFLDPFNDEFRVRFTIHVYNIFNRAKSGFSLHNPLAVKLKISYPLIYDIAVAIAQELKKDCGVHLSEDEIAYIALHVGGYFENNSQSKNKTSCVFVYADYYDSHVAALKKLTNLFSESLHIKSIVSITQYNHESDSTDLIISTVDGNFECPHVVIQPFLTGDDIANITKATEKIQGSKQADALKTYLLNFFNPRLFFKNPSYTDKTDAIKKLSQNVIQLGYADASLTEAVLMREAMSDTAFGSVAVPHALQGNTYKSFLSFAISDTPIQWGAKEVNIVLLIGVSGDSKTMFTQLFDYLVTILSNTTNVRNLSLAKDYDDFLSRLTKHIEAAV